MAEARILRTVPRLRRFLEDLGAGRVVLASGCFDPLHVGHVRYLYGAKRQGDTLVVAVHDDVSARRLKGEQRPIVPARDRARLVAQFEMVDAVLIVGAPDLRRVLRALRPAVLAKGTDYAVEKIPERESCRALGIEMTIVGDPKCHASHDVVDRIQARGSGETSRTP